jgi:TorA maturation chaperone TorD
LNIPKRDKLSTLALASKADDGNDDGNTPRLVIYWANPKIQGDIQMNKTKLGVKELADIARARAAFSSFLTIHFNALPDEKFVKQMRSKEITSMLALLPKDESVNEDTSRGASLMSNFLKETSGDKPAQLSQKLGVDRTRLYRGLAPTYGPPPPYEMVWSQKWQDVALLQALAATYRENNLAQSTEIIDRMDYLGVELEFIHALSVRETDAWDAGKTTKARSLLEEQKKFFQEHLESWVPSFIPKALEFVETDFYRGHLLMLQGFISEQAGILATISSTPKE